jgi:hypothetical protein
MMTNRSSLVRVDFNTLEIGEVFTINTLSGSTGVSTKDVSSYIFRAKRSGYCEIYNKNAGRIITYKKIKDDTTMPRDNHPHKPRGTSTTSICLNKYPDLNFNAEGTDSEIVDKLTLFAKQLKQVVMDLTDKVSVLNDKNKELVTDNAQLRAEVDNYRIQVPKLQDEVREFRKIKAIRTIKI